MKAVKERAKAEEGVGFDPRAFEAAMTLMLANGNFTEDVSDVPEFMDLLVGRGKADRTQTHRESTGAAAGFDVGKFASRYAPKPPQLSPQARLNNGKVVIDSTPTIAAGLLPEVIRAFGQRASGADVELLDDVQGQMLDRVISGAVDFALVPVCSRQRRIEPISAAIPTIH